jgi:hypothetical protein
MMMLERARNYGLGLLIALVASPALIGQVEPQQVSGNQPKVEITAEEIIKLSESKLYSPLDAGLKDLYFIHKTALRDQYRTYWFLAPDRYKAIYGRPKSKPRKDSPYSKLFKNLEPDFRIPKSVVHRSLGRLLGRPISCLFPFGTFEIIKKDESGTQLRFTADVEDTDNLVWTHIDFYLDPDFRLTKVMQKLVPDGRIEEYRIKLKPYREEAELLVVDEEVIIAGTENWQSTSTGKYRYAPHGDYWLVDSVQWKVQGDKKEEKFLEKYMDYKTDQGIDPSVFDEDQVKDQ